MPNLRHVKPLPLLKKLSNVQAPAWVFLMPWLLTDPLDAHNPGQAVSFLLHKCV